MPEDKGIEASLTYEEKSALRYTAGYVTRAFEKKLKRSSNPLKEKLIQTYKHTRNLKASGNCHHHSQRTDVHVPCTCTTIDTFFYGTTYIVYF